MQNYDELLMGLPTASPQVGVATQPSEVKGVAAQGTATVAGTTSGYAPLIAWVALVVLLVGAHVLTLRLQR